MADGGILLATKTGETEDSVQDLGRVDPDVMMAHGR
jgi:hypothetical protein